MDDRNIHGGHRERVKASVLAHGIDGLNDHQVLETLLFYSIPRKDTNPTAHRLIERFGSLRGVLEADCEELKEVEGVTGNTATLIKFSQLLAGRYLRAASFEDSETLRFADTDSLRRYYEGVFLGVQEEQVRIMALDGDLCMIDEKQIFDGTIGKVDINIRKIVDFAIRSKCSRLVLAHNHPCGMAIPSRADVAATVEIVKTLDKLDIELVDHVIIGKSGNCSFSSSPGIARVVWPNRAYKKGRGDDKWMSLS